MEYLLIGLAVVLAIYALFRFGLHLYRPFLLNKVFNEIQTSYDKMLRIIDDDLKSAEDNLNKWRSGNRMSPLLSSSEELKQSVLDANDSREHFLTVNDKYIRLRERFIHRQKKLAEAVLCYKRYLDLRLKQHSDARSQTQMLEHDVVTFDEWLASANEIRIMVEEAERKLDALLADEV